MSDRHLRVGLVEESSSRAWALARAATGRLRRAALPGLVDITPAYTTVVLEFDLALLDADRVRALVDEAVGDLTPEDAVPGRLVEIPVCYEGEFAPDIAEVARLHGMTEAEVATMHAGAEYAACFVGFMPGFAYLGGLPTRLVTPRLDRPRVRVPAGSVGIAGDQTGVYPFASPGGWRLIGRTPVRMFDADRVRPALVEAGDRVRFVAMTEGAFREVESEQSSEARAVQPDRRSPNSLRVIAPGIQTTVQDLGRPGLAALGVPRGGAADPELLRVANGLVGNDEGAACLELTLSGGVFQFERDSTIAVCESGYAGRVSAVRAGERWEIPRSESGARAYLAVSGGVDVPVVLGSRSTNLGAGFGGFEGRALRKDDRVGVGASPAGATVPVEVRSRSPRRLLRIVASGAHGFAAGALKTLVGGEYRIGAQSSRVGLRLEGPPIQTPGGGRMISEGMMWGAIQVPEDGQPIVLMSDYPTTGGYPVIACVIMADLPRLGQLRPEDVVRVEAIETEQARDLGRWPLGERGF